MAGIMTEMSFLLIWTGDFAKVFRFSLWNINFHANHPADRNLARKSLD